MILSLSPTLKRKVKITNFMTHTKKGVINKPVPMIYQGHKTSSSGWPNSKYYYANEELKHEQDIYLPFLFTIYKSLLMVILYT